MALPISNILPAIQSIPTVPGSSDSEAKSGGVSFGDVLNKAMDSLNESQQASSKMNEALASGNIDDLHTVMIESQKADLALQFTLQVRNKILDAYNEIMRMQI